MISQQDIEKFSQSNSRNHSLKSMKISLKRTKDTLYREYDRAQILNELCHRLEYTDVSFLHLLSICYRQSQSHCL